MVQETSVVGIIGSYSLGPEIRIKLKIEDVQGSLDGLDAYVGRSLEMGSPVLGDGNGVACSG